MSKSPRVSVIMPVYQAEQYVAESISSILAQTYSDFELIVINDGSTDGSVKVISSFKDPRIRLINNEKNSGLAAVRNIGINESCGEFIAWLDSDDLSLPARFEKQLAFFEAHPEVIAIGTDVRTIGSIADMAWHYPEDSNVLKSRMLFDDPFAISSVMCRRKDIIENKLYFDLDYSPASDFDFWERMSHRGSLSNLPEILTLYRLHETQMTSYASGKTLQQAEVWKIQSRQLERLGITPSSAEQEIHQELGKWSYAADLGFQRAAEHWLLRLDQSNKEKNIFDLPSFEKVLSERWMGICYAASPRGLACWSNYFNSSLRNRLKISRLREIKLLLKCLRVL